jgi:hypothetical protein
MTAGALMAAWPPTDGPVLLPFPLLGLDIVGVVAWMVDHCAGKGVQFQDRNYRAMIIAKSTLQCSRSVNRNEWCSLGKYHLCTVLPS